MTRSALETTQIVGKMAIRHPGNILLLADFSDAGSQVHATSDCVGPKVYLQNSTAVIHVSSPPKNHQADADSTN